MAERDGLWVYAVTGTDVRGCLGGVRGVAGGPVCTVTAAGLTAITEHVPLDGFGEAALRRNLEDLDWLAAAARAHHRVISAAAQQIAVVPMRLAIVYRDEQGMRAALAGRAADFRAVLDRIGAQREWGVKAYAVGRPEATAPPGGAPPGPAEPGAGAAYLRRRRDQISGQDQARRSAQAAARVVHAALAGQAGQARLHPPQAPQLSGNRDPMLLNAAYLVDERRGGGFADLVSALGGQHPDLRLELTGPWPPYSFAGLDEEGLEDPR